MSIPDNLRGQFSADLLKHPAWEVLRPHLEKNEYMCAAPTAESGTEAELTALATKTAQNPPDISFSLLDTGLSLSLARLEIHVVSPTFLVRSRRPATIANIEKFIDAHPVEDRAIVLFLTEDNVNPSPTGRFSLRGLVKLQAL